MAELTTTAERRMDTAPDQRTKGASVLGASLSVSNRGVRALGVSLASLIADACPDAAIRFHYGNRAPESKVVRRARGDVGVQIVNCRMSPRSRRHEHILVILGLALLYRLGIKAPARRNPWLRALLDASFIGDIRGGDSFSDIYGFRRFAVGSLPLLSVALLGCRYTMLPQTYGPFRHPASRALARFLLRRAATLLTRDKNCQSWVGELAGKRVDFCPDVAFTLEPVQPSKLRTTPLPWPLDRTRPLIGVNVSGLLFMGGYTGRNMFGLREDYRHLIEQLLERLLVETDATLLLVPHEYTAEREVEACQAVMSSLVARFPGRLALLDGEYDERELKWVIGQTDFFVGSRMHACIAALSQGVPAIGLAYSDKFLGVFESVGMRDAVVDLRTVDLPGVLSAVTTAFTVRSERARALAATLPATRSAVVTTFQQLFADRIVPLQQQAWSAATRSAARHPSGAHTQGHG